MSSFSFNNQAQTKKTHKKNVPNPSSNPAGIKKYESFKWTNNLILSHKLSGKRKDQYLRTMTNKIFDIIIIRCAVISMSTPGSTKTYVCKGLEGRYINIVIPTERRKTLTLCEVKVTGRPVTVSTPSPGDKKLFPFIYLFFEMYSV